MRCIHSLKVFFTVCSKNCKLYIQSIKYSAAIWTELCKNHQFFLIICTHVCFKNKTQTIGYFAKQRRLYATVTKNQLIYRHNQLETYEKKSIFHQAFYRPFTNTLRNFIAGHVLRRWLITPQWRWERGMLLLPTIVLL